MTERLPLLAAYLDQNFRRIFPRSAKRVKSLRLIMLRRSNPKKQQQSCRKMERATRLVMPFESWRRQPRGHHARDRIVEFAGFYWLGYVSIRSCLQATRAVFLHGMAVSAATIGMCRPAWEPLIVSPSRSPGCDAEIAMSDHIQVLRESVILAHPS
jgi:hypothetical protein